MGMPQDGALSEQGSTRLAVEVHPSARGRLREGGAECPLALLWQCKGLSNWRGPLCPGESRDEGVCGVAAGRAVRMQPGSP